MQHPSGGEFHCKSKFWVFLHNLFSLHIAGSLCGPYDANPVFWLAIRADKMYPSHPLGIACFDPVQGKNCMERTYKLCNIWKMSAIKMQRAKEHSQNKENTSVCREFICYKHSWLSYLALEINKALLILKNAKKFCYIINPLLTKLVRSRLLDSSLLLLFLFLCAPTLSQSIRMQKTELGQYLAILSSRLVNNA